MKNEVIIIAGPTASGKTDLAIEIAKRKNGEIISADSMQIYKGMSVATAKPTKQQLLEAKHHLVDFLDCTEKFSVAKFKELSTEKIEEIIKNGKAPIVVGGTGLYIDSLLNNTEFCSHGENEIRKTLEKKAEQVGFEKMLCELSKIDPQTAQRLHVNDKKRIIRAFEVYYLTGKTLTEQNENSHAKESSFDFCLICLGAKNRQYLYDRINKRVDLMIENGLVEEAKRFFSSDASNTAAQAIGYKELKPFLDGEASLEQAVEKLKQETRRYAKRQLTWFRRYENANWLNIDEDDLLGRSMEIIENYERLNANERRFKKEEA